MTRSRRLAAVCALGIVPVGVALTGCGSSSSSSSTTASNGITIAVEAPLSGAQASNGQDMLRGVELAVDQQNAAGGVLGKQIAIVQADDKADPATGVTVADQMVAQHVAAVIGPYNSSVGTRNLPIYVAGKVVPVQMTSTDDTSGEGVTVQPKNSQISPVEITAIAAQSPKRVAMLVDPSTYTAGMASRLAAGLTAKGITVTSYPIAEGKSDYTSVLAQALATDPGVLYLSTYFPEGATIAKEFAQAKQAGSTANCFAGLANQDPGFVTAAGVAASQLCTFSGVPTPQDLPTAAAYASAYQAKFGKAPATWGTFTYDSAKILFAAMTKTKSTAYAPVLAALRQTKDYPGATGPITIAPTTGDRTNVPVVILKVNSAGDFVVSK